MFSDPSASAAGALLAYSQNVLVAEGGLLKIADLGISQLLDHVFTRELVGACCCSNRHSYGAPPLPPSIAGSVHHQAHLLLRTCLVRLWPLGLWPFGIGLTA